MDDRQIVELFWQRSERALTMTAEKYGRYLDSIARNILSSWQDSEECVNDTYHSAWQVMPPHRPAILSAFLGKITRRIAIDRWRRQTADKRGGGQMLLALEELEECVAGTGSVEDAVLRRELIERIGRFVEALPGAERKVFLCRYWYLDSIDTIAARMGWSRSKVTSMLHRTRNKLRTLLETEGYGYEEH